MPGLGRRFTTTVEARVSTRLDPRGGPVRLFGLYLVLAGAARFLVEFLRRDAEVLFGLTQPQLFAAAFGMVGVVLLLARRLRMHPASLTGGV